MVGFVDGFASRVEGKTVYIGGGGGILRRGYLGFSRKEEEFVNLSKKILS